MFRINSLPDILTYAQKSFDIYLMTLYFDRLESSIFIPRPFYLLTNDRSITHEEANRYWIVEPKIIPVQIPIICSCNVLFYHKILVQNFVKSGLSISDIRQVYLWRRSDNFSNDEYYTLTVINRLPFAEICDRTFEPSDINMVDENGVLFFSRDYYNRIKEDTLFEFQGSSSIRYLMPL
jgi:hypothetical protein